MNDKQTPANHALPWGMSWLTLVLALLAVGTFFAVPGPAMRYITPMMGGVMETGSGKAMPPTAVGRPAMDMEVSNQTAPDMGVYYPSPYPYPSPDVPVTDTREFLKVYYSAYMRTRDVPGLTRHIETIVRGYDGRIDQESSSPEYGSISFALSQSRYDAFRTELESLVDKRFISVNISSQNMLSQKVSIEEQQKQADKALADYKTARQTVVSNHLGAVQSLQSKIDADNAELVQLRAQTQTPQIQAQIQTLSADVATLNTRLAKENASYASQLSNADASIKYAENWQKGVATQDATLLANVATVTGTVSIQWISLWDIALLYLPGYWIPFIFAVLAVLSFLRDRRRLIR